MGYPGQGKNGLATDNGHFFSFITLEYNLLLLLWRYFPWLEIWGFVFGSPSLLLVNLEQIPATGKLKDCCESEGVAGNQKWWCFKHVEDYV